MLFLSTILASAIALIPSPKSLQVSGGSILPAPCEKTTILNAAQIDELFKNPSTYGITLEIGDNCFSGASEWGTKEGYRMDVTEAGVKIFASTKVGAMYAIQTYIQLCATGRLYPGTIIDEPSHRYRGILFDVSRHFRDVAFIKKQLNAMAFLKLNRLHFHLDDSVGWRLELDSHPELVASTSFRKELYYIKPSTFLGVPEDYVPGTVWNAPDCYGGYYSKSQMKEIIAYADSLNITIIPEIEVPGHSGEFHACHPELFCPTADATSESVCPGREETFKFYQEILSEVIDLFPSEYIHIGGDEARKDSWKTCPLCRKRIADEHLKDEQELQSYTIRRIADFVTTNGKKIIGWDEIMEGGLHKDATVMCWRDVKYGKEAATQGNDVIMTPMEYLYLDKYQNSNYLEPEAMFGYVPFDKVCSFCLPESKNIIGVQANLWSEYIVDDSQYEYMLYPRAFAVAQLGWSSWESAPTPFYEGFRENAKELSGLFRKSGYTVFDLDREQEPDAIILGSVTKHKAYQATYTYTGLHPEQKPEMLDTRLTDGKERTSLRFDGPGSVTIKLKKRTNICVVCGVFQRKTGRDLMMLPSEVRVWVSQDGKKYSLAGVRRPLADDTKTDWQISYFPVFGEHKGIQYVRVDFTPSASCKSTGLTEIIVE